MSLVPMGCAGGARVRPYDDTDSVITALNRDKIVTLTNYQIIKLRLQSCGQSDTFSTAERLSGKIFQVTMDYPNYIVSLKKVLSPEENKRFYSHVRFTLMPIQTSVLLGIERCAGGYPIHSSRLGSNPFSIIHGISTEAPIATLRLIIERGSLLPSSHGIDLSKIQMHLSGRTQTDIDTVKRDLTTSWRSRTNWCSTTFGGRYQEKIGIIWDINSRNLNRLEARSSSGVSIFAQKNTKDAEVVIAQKLPLEMAKAIMIRDACFDADMVATEISGLLKVKGLSSVKVLRVS